MVVGAPTGGGRNVGSQPAAYTGDSGMDLNPGPIELCEEPQGSVVSSVTKGGRLAAFGACIYRSQPGDLGQAAQPL